MTGMGQTAKDRVGAAAAGVLERALDQVEQSDHQCPLILAAGEGRRGELIPAGRSRSLRSYGSMTYAGFKSMLYAGLSPDDVRVRAAFDWIRRNWTFDENPGLGQQGLYYYYMVMAQALDTAGIHKLQVPGEKEGETRAIEWRPLLRQKLFELQTQDGSWLNDKNDRWWEDQKLVCTVYALLALERCN